MAYLFYQLSIYLSMDFDSIAPIYDRLALWVFGESLNLAKRENLSRIEIGSSILVIGGGTGEIIEYIDKSTSGCTIWFCEKSEQMIIRAKNRKVKHNTVRYLNTDVFNLPYRSYNVIISNFFMDMLSKNKIIQLIDRLKEKSNNNQLWLVADFKNSSLIRNMFIKIMYVFFAITAKSRVFRFPNIDTIFKQAGFQCITEKEFGYKTVFARVYKHQNHKTATISPSYN